MPIQPLDLTLAETQGVGRTAPAFASTTACSSQGLLIQNPAHTGTMLRQSSIVNPKTTGVTSHRRQYASGAAFCFDNRFTVTPRATRRLIQTTATPSHRIT